MLDKSEAACRQLVHRASERVREQRPRFEVASDTHRTLLQKFVAAAQSGRREAVKELLVADAQALSDGGGKVRAVSALMLGADRIANLYWAIGKRSGEHMRYRIADINGEPGLLRYYDGRLESATAFVFDAGRIAAIYSIRNPDKLARIAAALQTF